MSMTNAVNVLTNVIKIIHKGSLSMSYKEIEKIDLKQNPVRVAADSSLTEVRLGILQNKINEIIEALNAEKANDPQELCGHILQHTIAGEIKCAEKRPCKFHDVPEKAEPTLKSDEQIQMDYYDLLNREEKAERCPACKGTGGWMIDGLWHKCTANGCKGKLSTSGEGKIAELKNISKLILKDEAIKKS